MVTEAAAKITDNISDYEVFCSVADMYKELGDRKASQPELIGTVYEFMVRFKKPEKQMKESKQ